MSQDVFLADYAACRDTNREIKSNLNYITDILERLSKMDSHASNVSVSDCIWKKDIYEEGLANLKKYLNEETDRYNNFHSTFESFYTPLKSIDQGLKTILENSFQFIDKNKDYGVYMSIIKSSQIDSLKNEIYEKLISQGISKEDAAKIAILEDEDTKKLIQELAALDESELKSKIDEIKNKSEKSPAELVLCDIFSLNDGKTYSDTVKDFSKELSIGGLQGVLEKGLLGKTLDEYNLDIKSLTGEINKLEKQITNSKLGKARINVKSEILDRLKNTREDNISNIIKCNNGKMSLKKLSNSLKIAGYVWDAGKILVDDYKNVAKNGEEIEDVTVDTGIGIGKIVGTAWASGVATSYVTGEIGTAVEPGGGTLIGMGAGFVGGALFSFAYDGIIKPIAKDVNDKIIKPSNNWIADKVNDIGDWWDSLWW